MKRVVGSVSPDRKTKRLYFKNDNKNILIDIIALKIVYGEPWRISIKGFNYRNNFEFLFYERWNNDKVFDKIIDIIKKEDKAKKAVFSRIFKEKI